MTPSIAEDIQMLVNVVLDSKPISSVIFEAAERVEVYLSTFKPDHL